MPKMTRQTPAQRKVVRAIQRWLKIHEYKAAFKFKLHTCELCDDYSRAIALCRSGVVISVGVGCTVNDWTDYPVATLKRLFNAAKKAATKRNKPMTPRQRFAKEHNAPLMDVNHFANIGSRRALILAHECNGDPHERAIDQKDKNECAHLWGRDAKVLADQMTKLAQQWGFDHLDFGVGFYPTLQTNEDYHDTTGTVHFPYDD
jgi:hypothetical protein